MFVHLEKDLSLNNVIIFHYYQELRFLEEYNTTQLHLKAILSLYEMKRSTGSLDPLLQIRPEDLMKVYGEIDQ